MPDDTLWSREVVGSKGFAEPFLGLLAKVVVLARRKGLMRTQLSLSAEGEDWVSARIEGEFCCRIAAANGCYPGVNIMFLFA